VFAASLYFYVSWISFADGFNIPLGWLWAITIDVARVLSPMDRIILMSATVPVRPPEEALYNPTM
ncbi:MAG: hypothetical protein M3352_06420, partial [Bacteroidota bacterium]|nr:hypothetical protein [Bacteroidota bacterium]